MGVCLGLDYIRPFFTDTLSLMKEDWLPGGGGGYDDTPFVFQILILI